MEFNFPEGNAGVLLALLAPVMSWFASDVRFKTRSSSLENGVKEVIGKHEDALKHSAERISILEGRIDRSEVDRTELHRSIERLDNQKASKEMVEAIRADIRAIQQSIESRFDRMERLFSSITSTLKGGRERGAP